MTSKGQITIPKKVREFLNIDSPGDVISFMIPEDGTTNVVIEKIGDDRKCPVCDGKKVVDDFECIVCKGTGFISKVPGHAINDLLDTIQHCSVKNMHISYSIVNQIRQDEGYKISTPVTYVILQSDDIPMSALENASDYYQLRIIKENSQNAPVRGLKGIERPVNDNDLQAILSYLNNEWAKDAFLVWLNN